MQLNTENRAAYRVLDPAGFFGDDDHLYPEGAEIYFDGEPNEQMEPLNETARDRLAKYLQRLDEGAKATAEKFGRPFVSRPRTLDGAIALATEDMRNNMSIMGTKNKQSSIEKVERESIPDTGKRGRGRPKGSLNNRD